MAEVSCEIYGHRGMETREKLKIDDTGLINQQECGYYRVTGKTPALIHFFVTRQSSLYIVRSYTMAFQ